jgi:hypothetical protein
MTENGKTLTPVIHALQSWGSQHLEKRQSRPNVPNIGQRKSPFIRGFEFAAIQVRSEAYLFETTVAVHGGFQRIGAINLSSRKVPYLP